MDKKHQEAFEKLEATKEVLLSQLAEREHGEIAARKNEKWSPLQHCFHLYLAEMYSRKYCEKKLSFKPELKDAGIKHRFRVLSLKITEYVPIKLKAPETINEQVFPKDMDLEMLRKAWEEDRKKLKLFLDNLDPQLIKKEIYKHPFAGRLTISGMLEFFQFHQDRHAGHIRKQYGIGG